MAYQTNTKNTGRDIFFNTAGDANAEGATTATPVDSPTTAIARINALSPVPSGTDPASINASVTGTYIDGITTPDSTSIKCAFASIITTDAFCVTSGSSQSNDWGALLAFANNSTNFIISGVSRVAADINAMVVGTDLPSTGSTGNVGFEISGVCDDIFIKNTQMELRGDGAIGIEYTATSQTPIRIEVNSVEFFNRNQTFFTMNSPDPFEQTTLTLTAIQEAIDATEVVANSCVTRVESGILTVTAQTLIADSIAIIGADGQYSLDAHVVAGDILVETGGQAILRDIGLWIGDIVVEEGAILSVIIQVHQSGTVTNNGTINGIIDGVCYGTYCDHPEILTSPNTGQVLVSKNTGNVLISGEV